MAIKIQGSTIIDDGRNIVSAGVVTATNFVGDLTGTATTATDARYLNYNGQKEPSYFLDYNNFTNTPTSLSSFSNDVGFSTVTYVDTQVGLSTVGLASISYVDNLVAISTFSGDYNDLTNQPSIPSIVGLASEGYVDTSIANLLDSAPETLNTLNELAAALGDDANFATTVTNSLATKANLSGANFTGVVTATSFVKSGGTSSQFLKADGSVDSSIYLKEESDTLASVINRGNISDNGITVGISTVNNHLSITSTDGNTGRLDLYCEVNNAHYTRIEAAPHSEYSGNATVVAPTVSGDIIVGDTASAISQNLNTTGIITAASFSGSGSNLTDIPLDSDFTSNGFMKRTGSGSYTVDTNTYLTSTGSGVNLSGIVTSIAAGSGISIDQATGEVTITATGGISESLAIAYAIAL